MAITSVNKDFLVKNGLVVNTTATILGTASSVSTQTGALIVSGGVGVGGDVNAKNIFAREGGNIALYHSTSSYYVGFTAPPSLSTSTVWKLPTADGTNGQYLITNGAGQLQWVDLGDTGYPPFPTGDYGDGEAYPSNFLFNDAFGVSLVESYDCMNPTGVMLEEDFGTL